MKHFASLLLVFIGFSAVLDAQTSKIRQEQATVLYERARDFYQESKTDQALESLRKALILDSNSISSWLLQAVIMEDLLRYDSAISCYYKALKIDPEYFPNAYYTLAKLENNRGLYKEADLHVGKFLSYPKISANLKRKAESLQLQNKQALEYTKTAVPFEPFNLGSSINTEEDEYLPVLTIDGSALIYTRKYMRNDPEPHLEEDFFIAYRDSNGAWLPGTPMPSPINSSYNEGAQSISADGKYLFFTICNHPHGLGSCDIFVSRKTADSWSKPFPLGKPVNSEAWESQPSFASDGKTLYFASTRAGGYGRSDIWKSELLDNGMWSEPVNLGPNINTSGDEFSPFIHPDQKTLYFSSNGHPGLGGLDLFYSKLDSNRRWGKPVNLGFPINTFADEATLSVNASGDTAYYSTDVEGGFGKRDIFGFRLYEQARPTLVSFMKGRVTDAVSRQPLSAKFELIDIYTQATVLTSYSDEKDGSFLVALASNSSYALNVSCNGYLFHSEHFALEDIHAVHPLQKEIALSPIQRGEKIVLKNIFYETNRFELRETSLPELDKLYEFLVQNPEVSIRISGHTDNTGSEELNLKLSQKRSDAVASYLIQKGISASRIQSTGYGMSRPIGDNATEEGRAQNRRTEMEIL